MHAKSSFFLFSLLKIQSHLNNLKYNKYNKEKLTMRMQLQILYCYSECLFPMNLCAPQTFVDATVGSSV